MRRKEKDGIPDAAADVYIESGSTITLTESEVVHDIHIATGTLSATAGNEGVVALGGHKLSVSGKIRCYFANVSVVPGHQLIP